MRRQDHVVHAEQRVVVADRLGLQHVEASAGDPAFLQGLDHRRLVDRRAASGVHEQRRLLHQPEVTFLHQVMGVLGAGRMHGHDVRALQQLVEPDRLHAVVGHHQLLDIGIVGQHLEAERRSTLGDGARDMAERDEAQRHAHQARELVECRPRLGPFALAHHLVLHHQPPPARQDQGHGVIGHFLDERVGAVGHRDAELRGDVDIDGVHADRTQRHDLQLLARFDHLGGDARPALGVDRVGIGHGLHQLVFAATHFDDFRVERRQGFHFQRMIGRAGSRRHDLETCHVLSPPGI